MMIRLIFCLFLVSNAYSHSSIFVCPTVEEIKKGFFHGWLPLYIDSEELAFNEDMLQFIKGVETFLVAKWDKDYLENGHCFYNGTPITSKIILAHDAWRPQQNPDWHWIKNGALAECYASSPTNCEFLE